MRVANAMPFHSRATARLEGQENSPTETERPDGPSSPRGAVRLGCLGAIAIALVLAYPLLESGFRFVRRVLGLDTFAAADRACCSFAAFRNRD
jgi:hypothetical protein